MKKIITGILFTLLLVACSNGGEDKLKVDDVIATFKKAGLEAESPRKMTKDDYGLAPMKAYEAKIVKLPSLCDDCNARIFSFENEEDLEQTKKFYDDLGKESAMLFSWTIKHKNILVQLNGDLPEEQYNKYKKALEGM
jgi:hypothetical protein